MQFGHIWVLCNPNSWSYDMNLERLKTRLSELEKSDSAESQRVKALREMRAKELKALSEAVHEDNALVQGLRTNMILNAG